MKTLYHYRKERHYPKPPEVIWPCVADTARINELSGSPPYQVEEQMDAHGRVNRVATVSLGPLRIRWQEGFSEWEENRRLIQTRHFLNGPIRRFEAAVELHLDDTGTRMVFSSEIECVGVLGLLAKLSGQIDREGDKRLAAVEKLIAESEIPGPMRGAYAHEAAKPAARRRLAELTGDLKNDPASHGLAPKLADFLLHAPIVELRAIRPLALARFWSVPANDVVELFLAAQRRGIVAMSWDLLCSRCRGAKLSVKNLHELPEGAHCSSCNIDYGRDFTRNVELTFHPEPWLRPLPKGELCLLGQGSTPHVKFQGEVPARATKNFPLHVIPGPYRFRTIEAGGETDAEIGEDGGVPEVTARGDEMILSGGRPGELIARNDTDRPLIFVVESRAWTADALTGERVIAMPAFRRLCPEQLLRPGDEVEIGWIAIMFTDLQGSTRLYDDLGDASAYRLVRDHFAFLSERVERHHGFIVKTVGDAVMAAFHDPADAVRAALSIQDDVESFNHGRSDAGIVLKLGLHGGTCIAVTAGGVLDYFGSVVNTASRLEHQCQGGEVIVSEAVSADSEAREALTGRALIEDSATLRGLSEPVRFVRVAGRSPPL
jgi:class 3 adenylate cyclase